MSDRESRDYFSGVSLLKELTDVTRTFSEQDKLLLKKGINPYQRYVKELTSKDFENLGEWMLRDKSCSLVLFYAPYCPYCKEIIKEWGEAARTAGGIISFKSFNSQKNRELLNRIKSDMPSLVSSFPTIIFYKNGEPQHAFEGERLSKNFINFATNNCSL